MTRRASVGRFPNTPKQVRVSGHKPSAPDGTTHRVIVCGSRRWNDRELIAMVLTDLMIERGWNPVIVHGGARGADRIAEEEAGKAGFLTEPHLADWDRYGKRAGLIRNEEMAKLGADLCIAFWDGKSTGTWHMVEQAKKYDIQWEIHCGRPGNGSLEPARSVRPKGANPAGLS